MGARHAEAQEKGYRTALRRGRLPTWKEICAAVESVGGVEYYLMEQEGSRFPEFETAERCLASWKDIAGEDGLTPEKDLVTEDQKRDRRGCFRENQASDAFGRDAL